MRCLRKNGSACTIFMGTSKIIKINNIYLEYSYLDTASWICYLSLHLYSVQTEKRYVSISIYFVFILNNFYNVLHSVFPRNVI